MDPERPDSPRYNSDAPIRVSVLHGGVVRYGSFAVVVALVHIRKEDGRNKDLPRTTPLQFVDEGIRFRYGAPLCI